MNLKLKVCGMRDADNIVQVTSQHPDYMGFIFYPQSPRFAGKDFKLAPSFPPAVKKVGVFVNETIEVILETVDRLDLDYVQLHGNESAEQCHSIKNSSIGVIKVFSIDDDFDFSVTKDFQKAADFFLFDTKGKYHGGNAIAFDWNVLKRYDQEKPFFLSGGISPANVKGLTLLSGMNIHALDINSGIEDKPGVKNIHRLDELKNELEKLKI
jgi:phosphoribosylanthranilate isomerase